MRVGPDSPLRLTLALRHPDTAVAAVRAVAGRADTAAVEGLLELAHADRAARPVEAAVRAVAAVDHPLARDLIRAAIGSRFAPARLAAVEAAHARRWPDLAADLRHVLAADPSWPNRRAAVLAVADLPDPLRGDVLLAADDPHWRVRHAVVRVLADWGGDEPARADILSRLAQTPGLRPRGLAAYLRWLWYGAEPDDWAAFVPPDPAADCPLWDRDPAVLAAKLDRLGPAGRHRLVGHMPFLAAHPDERVWKPAVDAIRAAGDPALFAAAVRRLTDPRGSGPAAVARLFARLDSDLLADVRRLAGDTPPPPPPAAPPSPGHPFLRAAALTPERAAELVADPGQETSWHVLEAACRLAKVPVWHIEPADRWEPVPPPPPPADPMAVAVGPTPHVAYLGAEKLAVSRVGISGHYRLPPAGFAAAAEAGVDWFFWEPNYDTLTAFAGRLSSADRQRLKFVAGTFEADGRRVAADADRALRNLGVDRLGLFLVFWVQSWDRLTDDVVEAVRRLKADGKAAVVGLSTHDRRLAVRAMDAGWDPVMVRHSAAHRGAEAEVLPHAVGRGATVVTFNNLCYGRMLRPAGGLAPPSAADCYRYSLSRPGVAACWSAPATVEQLGDNLAALRHPHLPADRAAELRRFGDALYREEAAFRRLVRGV